MGRVLIVMTTMIFLTGCEINPVPFNQSELEKVGTENLSRVAANQTPVSGPITLYEAMARALKYNLDYKVELMEEALRARELDLARYDLLPQLVANAGYNGRANTAGASSRSLITGTQSLEPSTSSERNVFDANITLSWDVLDFGLSYVRAQQSADEVLIAMERKRRVVNRIIEDVRTAYWRAVSSERLIEKLQHLESDVEKALSDSESLVRRRNTSPLTALTYQRELLKIKQELQDLQRELVIAKKQLAALMNLPPAQDFDLVLPARIGSSLALDRSTAEMIRVAVETRPELREVAYRQRINVKEADIALLELLPNLKAFGGFNANSNDFLFNSNWVSWGAQASWNLMNVFRYPARKEAVAAQDALLDQRALALTMAVITQVHVANARYYHLSRELETEAQYFKVQTQIRNQIRAAANVNRVSRQTLIREEMNTLVAEVKYDIAFADLQNAYANVYASMGLDPFAPDIRGDESVDDLAASLAGLWASRGDNSPGL